MAEEVVVVVEFSELGEPIISVRGCKGPACRDLTRSLEAALGDVIEDTPTPEYFQEAVQQEKVKARQ